MRGSRSPQGLSGTHWCDLVPSAATLAERAEFESTGSCESRRASEGLPKSDAYGPILQARVTPRPARRLVKCDRSSPA